MLRVPTETNDVANVCAVTAAAAATATANAKITPPQASFLGRMLRTLSNLVVLRGLSPR